MNICIVLLLFHFFFLVSISTASDYNPKKELEYSNAGYYNPVTTPVTNSTNTFISNGFSSFMGSDISFNLEVIFSLYIFFSYFF